MRRVIGFSVGLVAGLALLAALPSESESAQPLSHLAPPPPAPPVRSRFARTILTTPIATESAQAAGPIAKHVIIISEDGLRPDLLAALRPPVHDDIMRRGAWSLSARTIRHASTLPSHAAMLSGFDVKRHGLHWNSWQPDRGYIQVPTVFDAAEAAGATAAVFVGKWKLQHIVRPGQVDVFARPGYLCRKVAAAAARYFTAHRPQIEFVHFSDPDDAGHAIGWMSDEQHVTLRATDRCLGALVKAVADSGVERDTLFILSADHGGHGRNHSGAVAEDRLIPWIAWGAGVKPNHALRGPISTVDTAATALWALGYPAPPDLAGRPVLEAFERR